MATWHFSAIDCWGMHTISLAPFFLLMQYACVHPRGHQLTKKRYGFQNLEQISQDFTDFKRFHKIEQELQNLILNYRLV